MAEQLRLTDNASINQPDGSVVKIMAWEVTAEQAAKIAETGKIYTLARILPDGQGMSAVLLDEPPGAFVSIIKRPPPTVGGDPSVN